MNGLGVPKQSEEPKGSVMLPLAVTSPQTERGSKEKGEISMMTKMDFAKAVKDAIEKKNDKYSIEIQRIVKMNDEELIGLVFREDGKESAPTVYVESAYEAYLDGEEVETLAHELDMCIRYLPEREDMEDLDMSWNAVKDKISMRLLGIARNKEYLEDKVYRDVGNGLALVFEIDIKDEYGTVVTKSLAEERGYDELELMARACANGKPTLTDMTQTLFGDPKNLLDEDEKLDGMMYVLSNDDCRFGASAIYMNGVAQKIAELVGDKYYVLPSSVHELIIVPSDSDKDARELKKIVEGANKSVLEARDILSDHVYQYVNDMIVEVA